MDIHITGDNACFKTDRACYLELVVGFIDYTSPVSIFSIGHNL